MSESSGGRASSLVVLLDLDPPLAAESDLRYAFCFFFLLSALPPLPPPIRSTASLILTPGDDGCGGLTTRWEWSKKRLSAIAVDHGLALHKRRQVVQVGSTELYTGN